MGTEKHLQICSIAIAAASNIELREPLGGDDIFYQGVFTKYKTTNVDFTESRDKSGGYVTQELKAVITSNNKDEQKEHKSWQNKECLLIISYTDGNDKMIGNEFSPVIIQVSQSGSPMGTTFQFKRLSADFAKFAKSFV